MVACCKMQSLRRTQIGIANNRGTPLLKEADHPIWLDTGSEPIAGSTRLIAGTAQKITLNLLSSLLMILLGRVYGGLMVDVQASNEKLLRRSENMLIRLTRCSRDKAREALGRARGSVKIAVILLNGCDLETRKRCRSRARPTPQGAGSDRATRNGCRIGVLQAWHRFAQAGSPVLPVSADLSRRQVEVGFATSRLKVPAIRCCGSGNFQVPFKILARGERDAPGSSSPS